MKISIITEYFHSANFGGNFQAYALCRLVSKITNNVCQQISYDKKSNNIFRNKAYWIFRSPFRFLLNCYYFLFNKEKYYCREKNILLQKKSDKYKISQYKAIKSFNIKIPHTKKIYNDYSNFDKLNKTFDCFIAGSDQIWNLGWYQKLYFLTFVNLSQYKFSYAASLGMEELNEKQKIFFRDKLKYFDAISVREEKAKELLQPLTEKEVVVTLDPTLLLDKSDWEEILEERKIDEKYLFCYFLGHSVEQRKLAEEYAKKHKLKIVSLPFLAENTEYDLHFGNYRLNDVTPNQLLSLIKNAEFVMSDSFHASVFSIIFKKQFVVFNRNSVSAMSSRIDTLTNLFDMKDRFCNTKDKESVEYIDSLKLIDYKQDFAKYQEAKKKSIDFLTDNLKKAEMTINDRKK